MSQLIEKLSSKTLLREAWKELKKNPSSQGVDDITIEEFRDKLESELEFISDKIRRGQYKPSLLLGHPLEKGKATGRPLDKKKFRILKIPTVRDRVVQKAIEMLISPSLNSKYKLVNNGVSFAYIANGGVDRAAYVIRDLHAKQGYSWVYQTDIKSFFDRINKKKLLERIQEALPDASLMGLITKFLDVDIVNHEQIQERTQKEYEYNPQLGVAQGSPLSPLFANVYLSDFDQSMIKYGLKMVRYADDILVMCKSKDDAIKAHQAIAKELSLLDLELHELYVKDGGSLPVTGHEKKSIVQKYKDVLFLGLRFTGSKIYPSSEAYKNAIWSVRRVVESKDPKMTFVKKLISIEARVGGWCSSYSFTDFLEDPTSKNDANLEKLLIKLLKTNGLITTGSISATTALGVENYKTRLTRKINEKKNPEKKRKKGYNKPNRAKEGE